jgi:putative ABC transport system permease protein
MRALFRRNSMEAELEAELRAHIEQQAEKYIEAGMSPEEAARRARLEFGGVEAVKEECRDSWGVRFINELGQDLRYGLRQLRRNPGFTFVAILTLALGIGANTAIFSVVDAALLRSLPFPDAGALVRLWDSYSTRDNDGPVSYPNFVDWKSWNHSFTGMAAIARADYVLTGQGEPKHLQGMVASASLFKVLEVHPILGRRFLPEEDNPHADKGADAIILSHKTWKGIFGADPSLIGQGITLDGKPFVIVGVAPPGVELFVGDGIAQFWTTAAPLVETSPHSPKPLSEQRQISFLRVIGRLKPGVTLQQAKADMDHVASELMRAYPKDDRKEGVTLKGLQQSLTGQVQPMLLILLAAVGVVLLIACANVAALLLARSTGREREMAIRAALGAGRWRIARQSLVESLLLALAGATAGVWMAAVTGNTMVRILGISWLSDAPLDGRVLGLAFLTAGLSAVAFGLASTPRVANTNLANGLKEGTRTAGYRPRSRRLRTAIVMGQLALAVTLLSAAGLLTHSLINLERTDPGFDPSHVLTFPVSLPRQQYRQSSWSPFFEQLVERLRGLPGVISASAGLSLPLQSGESRTVIDNVAGSPIPQREWSGIVFSPVTPGYFRTLHIPLKAGRVFTSDDTATSQAVVIINEAAARRYFGNRNPVGQQIEPHMWDGSGSKNQLRTIVGIVGNVKIYNLAQTADPVVYWPLAQVPSNSSLYVEVRTAGNPPGIIAGVRDQLHSMDKNLPVYDVQTLDKYVDLTLTQPRYNTLLILSFALLALILTTIGLYGSIAYSVAQRTREMGVRMALGAQKSDIVRMVIGEGLRLALIGVAIGIAGALALTRFIASLLYAVEPTDPLTFISVSLILIAVALLACYIPARRAAKVDPMVALRYE